MDRRLKFFIACVLTVVSLGAEASPVVTPIGNVTILGNDYQVSLLSDVSYATQSFNLLSPTVTFTTESDAWAAAAVLFSTFGGYYNWNPTCTDCADGVRIPYHADSQSYDYLTIKGYPIHGPFTQNRVEGNDFSFAQFTTAVPEPEIYAMMLAGLGLLGFGARRNKHNVAYADSTLFTH